MCHRRGIDEDCSAWLDRTMQTGTDLLTQLSVLVREVRQSLVGEANDSAAACNGIRAASQERRHVAAYTTILVKRILQATQVNVDWWERILHRLFLREAGAGTPAFLREAGAGPPAFLREGEAGAGTPAFLREAGAGPPAWTPLDTRRSGVLETTRLPVRADTLFAFRDSEELGSPKMQRIKRSMASHWRVFWASI